MKNLRYRVENTPNLKNPVTKLVLRSAHGEEIHYSAVGKPLEVIAKCMKQLSAGDELNVVDIVYYKSSEEVDYD